MEKELWNLANQLLCRRVRLEVESLDNWQRRGVVWVFWFGGEETGSQLSGLLKFFCLGSMEYFRRDFSLFSLVR